MKTITEKFRLWLLPEVEERIRHYVSLASGEVSGLGLVDEVEGGFLLTQVFLPRQECTAGGTELDQDWVAALMVTLEEEGIDSGKMKCWYHSHGSLDVFWSNTDHECVAGLANDNYFLSLVVNKAGDMLARLDVFRPVRITIDDVPVAVRSQGSDLLDSCRKEFEDRVKEVPGVLTARFPRLVGDDMLLPLWAGDDFADPGPFLHISQLEDAYADGEITWQEYNSRLREMGGAL